MPKGIYIRDSRRDIVKREFSIIISHEIVEYFSFILVVFPSLGCPHKFSESFTFFVLYRATSSNLINSRIKIFTVLDSALWRRKWKNPTIQSYNNFLLPKDLLCTLPKLHHGDYAVEMPESDCYQFSTNPQQATLAPPLASAAGRRNPR